MFIGGGELFWNLDKWRGKRIFICNPRILGAQIAKIFELWPSMTPWKFWNTCLNYCLYRHFVNAVWCLPLYRGGAEQVTRETFYFLLLLCKLKNYFNIFWFFHTDVHFMCFWNIFSQVQVCEQDKWLIIG